MVLREKFIEIQDYLKEIRKISNKNDLTLHPKELETKEEQMKLNVRRIKKIIKRVEINRNETKIMNKQ